MRQKTTRRAVSGIGVALLAAAVMFGVMRSRGAAELPWWERPIPADHPPTRRPAGPTCGGACH